MSLKGRVTRLEEQAGVKREFYLWDNTGNEVNADIVKKPTMRNEGLAGMPDGTEWKIAPLTSSRIAIIHTREGEDGVMQPDCRDVLYYGYRLINICSTAQ